MPRSAKLPEAPSPAASVGGPSVFRGLNYQTAYAILQALELVSQVLYTPFRPLSITVEPRILHEQKATRWDVELSPPLIVIEAKANATKEDLIEFLRRVSQSTGLDDASRLHFVYGKCNVGLLASVMRLSALATECSADGDKFRTLLEMEQIPNNSVIFEVLGSSYQKHLSRLVFENLPEKSLERDLNFAARHLTAERHNDLLNFLFREFSSAGASRRRYEVSDLIGMIERAGIPLTRPNEVDLSELPVGMVAVLEVLQVATSGLPEIVVAGAAGLTIEQLQSLSNSDLLLVEGDIYRSRPLPFRAFDRDRNGVLRRGFENLLDYLLKHETEETAALQLRNAVILARECLPSSPGLALPFFQATEHIVKNLGDKHLLLEISDLCIDASQRSRAGEAERRAQAKAQALLCGRSWVFQRTGRLKEARLLAENSLNLGIDIGWDRNTAFAYKCIGRLNRLESEQPETTPDRKRTLLLDSVSNLKRAINSFSTSSEFGPQDRQVGDSYSLLARTYLVMGSYADASAALKEAYEILSGQTKEYFDLLILNGDIEVTFGSRETAEQFYDQVIEQHPQASREHSEIYARALFRRGSNRAKLGRRESAILDFNRAAAVWRSLDEQKEAARAEWSKIEADGNLDSSIVQLFADADPSPLTRLAAFEKYTRQVAESKGVAARRSRLTSAQVQQYVKDARKANALEYPEW